MISSYADNSLLDRDFAFWSFLMFLPWLFLMYYPAGTTEKDNKMAQTNPMPMGPWKVSIWRTALPISTGSSDRLQRWRGSVSSGTHFSSVLCLLQITVYDQEYFQGRRMEFTASCQNIMECGMENIRSLKVECGAYVSRDPPNSADSESSYSETLKKNVWRFFCMPLISLFVFLTVCSQLGGLRALQLLRPAVRPGEGRLPPLWGLQRQQLLPHWEDDLLQAHLLRCRFDVQPELSCCARPPSISSCAESPSSLLLCAEPQGVPYDHLWEGEHDGPSVRAVRRLSFPAGHGLDEQRGWIHASSDWSVSLRGCVMGTDGLWASANVMWQPLAVCGTRRRDQGSILALYSHFDHNTECSTTLS